MSKQDRLQQVQQIYADLPDLECKGLCRTWCTGGIATTQVEADRLAERGVQLLPLTEGDSGKPCTALTPLGYCKVYQDRPLICRLWGTVENMACPHGCVPKGGHLSREQGGQVVMAMVDVAGEAS